MPNWEKSSLMRTILHDTLLNESMQSNFFPIGIFTGVVPKETFERQLTTSRSGNIPEEHIPETVKFLKTCLRLNPLDRPHTVDLIVDKWLEPAFACSCGYTEC